MSPFLYCLAQNLFLFKVQSSKRLTVSTAPTEFVDNCHTQEFHKIADIKILIGSALSLVFLISLFSLQVPHNQTAVRNRKWKSRQQQQRQEMEKNTQVGSSQKNTLICSSYNIQWSLFPVSLLKSGNGCRFSGPLLLSFLQFKSL